MDKMLPYFTHCMEVACWHKGWGGGGGWGGGKAVQQPKNPGPKPIKCLFLPNKKLMVVMKFSRTNRLNGFVFRASFL